MEESVKDILLKNGFIVTDKKFGGWDRTNRMITDLDGNEKGFYHVLNVLDELVYTCRYEWHNDNICNTGSCASCEGSKPIYFAELNR